MNGICNDFGVEDCDIDSIKEDCDVNNDEILVDKIKMDLEDAAVSIVSKLYGIKSLPLNIVQIVVNEINKFLK